MPELLAFIVLLGSLVAYGCYRLGYRLGYKEGYKQGTSDETLIEQHRNHLADETESRRNADGQERSSRDSLRDNH
jgi:hypothetical protein